MKRVIFFFPDRRIGGGPFYLLRMAVELSKSNEYEVYYIDYKDGYTHKIDIDVSKIKFIDFEDYSPSTIFIDDAVLFAPIHYLHNMPYFHLNTKVLFFNWHHECIPVLKNNMCFNDIELYKCMEIINKNNAQVFCDVGQWSENNRYSLQDFNKNYVPVHINMKNERAIPHIIDNNINICILGRLVLDKIYSVINIIECAKKYNKKNIVIHIIGDGDQKDKLNAYKEVDGIELRFLGVLSGDRLNNYLKNNIDILFAMGTSVLEGAAIGLPSIIIPYSIRPFHLDQFIYLYDTIGYCLGWDVNQLKYASVKKYSFNSIINYIYNENKKNEIGNKCFEYVENNHSVVSSTEHLKKYINSTTLKFKDIYSIYRIQCYINNIRMKKNKKYYKLFNCLNILKEISTNNYKKYYLFGCIPLLTIKIKC